MKKFVLLISFALLSFSSFAQSKVGTIDVEYIISKMPEMNQVNEGLKSYNDELQKNLQDSIAKYEILVKDYQANNTSLAQEEKQAKENEIIGLENEIKGFRQKAALMIQMKRNELTEPLYQKINVAMLEVVQEESFSQILHVGGNALAFSAEGFDITEKVLKKLGIEVTQ
ncbi:OmpH family outer membrane protein [Salinimicrobium sp. GXAS 041]|uniref:OmpH family outer membrane protein n=1 Tax=Salinimicrobium sp. GXAS 041 TaxID=3400806 RepID=UPI003C76535B